MENTKNPLALRGREWVGEVGLRCGTCQHASSPSLLVQVSINASLEFLLIQPNRQGGSSVLAPSDL